MQRVIFQYLIEWWENYALPRDPEILATYEQSWEDSTILDDLSEEYVAYLYGLLHAYLTAQKPTVFCEAVQ